MPVKSKPAVRYPVWDWPTRLCHWGLVIGLFAQFASGLFGWLPMASHLWLGYGLLVVVLFRVIWGFVGSDSARFSHFLHGPAAVLAYLRTLASAQPTRWPGHNPLGGWSSVALLTLTLLQSITGLFSSRRGGLEGPLVHLVSRDAGLWLDDLHGLLHWPLLLLVVVHIAAGFWYLLRKRENRISPIFGDGRLQLDADPRSPGTANDRALIVLAVALVAVAAVVVQAPQ